MAVNAYPPTIYPTAFFSNIRSITSSIISNDFDYVDMNGGAIKNLEEPVFPSDAATKNYVDTHGGGGGGNLTGPITAIGGVSSITSQTGTGTKFVVDTSPVLITPNIGMASGNSLTVSGQLKSNDTTDSTSIFTGAINTFGGISCHKDMYAGGTCNATDFLATSDRRLKSNIKDIEYKDIINLLKIKGYTYNLNSEKGIKYGVLAQDLENIGFDMLVDNNGSYKKVSYQSLIPIMIETIKMLEIRIEDNNTKFMLIEQRLKKIENKITKSDSYRKKRRSYKKILSTYK